MKRPPGITPPPPPPADPPAEVRAPAPKAPRKPRPAKPSGNADAQDTVPITPLPKKRAASSASTPPAPTSPATPARDTWRASDFRTPKTQPTTASRPSSEADSESEPEPRRSRNPVAAARRGLRDATRSRRRYEKAEARRFTQRSRRRRLAWLISGGAVAALVVVVLLAAYSPLLAVRTLSIEGTSRLDASAVGTALDGQLGTPLALVDYGAIESALAQFPLVESYSVEARPPDTLAIKVVERRPVAQVQTATGFDLIDAAGVTVQQSAERLEGFPVLDLSGTAIGSPGFRAAASVLMALPDALLTQVSGVSAATPDSVTMVFTGAGQRVVWGDADDNELKARILQQLIATQDAGAPVEYDVSSPQSPVIR